MSENTNKSISTKVKMIAKLFEESLSNLNAGNTNIDEETADNLIETLSTINRGADIISKAYACERILHCSASTFEKYVQIGLIPKGRKRYGFHELSWKRQDIENVKVRLYNRKNQ